jgi:hypothetical protein
MRWRRGKSERTRLGCGCLGAVGIVRRSGCISPLIGLAGLVLVCVTGLVGAAGAMAAPCPNQKFRSGPSADLPNCRAYELVTPADKGRTQALTFSGGATTAVPSSDGEGVALQTIVPLGPNPSLAGARAIFSRTETGWEMKSVMEPGANGQAIRMRLFSPDLSELAFESETGLNFGEVSEDIDFDAGPVGGPYALLAEIPRKDVAGVSTLFLGASASLSHVLFASVDHDLPLSGEERAAAEATDGGALDLYDWSGGNLHLVNVTENGSLLDQCGAILGGGGGTGQSKGTVNAVSQDGSKIFFTTPAKTNTASGPGCQEPTRLYMRVNGGEPLEVSAPEPGVIPPKTLPVRYNYATPNGSKVFFNTETVLTPGDTSNANKLFEYDTEAPEGERLKLIASGVPPTTGVGLEERKGFYFSEDGSTVYVESYNGVSQEINRYDASTGERSPVAVLRPSNNEPSSTPDGEYFLFPSEGVGGEPRGEGHSEMYRYDNASKSVMCVTCGAGAAPEHGEVVGVGLETVLESEDEVPALTQISEDGQRVFFQTTAQLVPQDTNSTTTVEGSANGHPGLDVYEWEAEGVEEAPGVFCGAVNGCTHLLSSGEDVGPSTLLGASRNGRDVFFESAARLTPQDTDEFPDIYDARVDGGFPPPPPPLECLSCQGVGSSPPLFGVPATGSFVGAGNLATYVKEKPKPKNGPKKKRPKAKRARSGIHRRKRGIVRHGGRAMRVHRRGV